MDIEKPGVEKAKTFKGGFWKGSIIPVIIPIIVAAAMTAHGLNDSRLFPPGADQSTRILLVFMPIIFAGLIVFVTFLAFYSNIHIRITFTKDRLYYKQGGKHFSCYWKELIYIPPRPGKKFMNHFTISDGKKVARINSAFFPDFDIVAKYIGTAKKEAARSGLRID